MATLSFANDIGGETTETSNTLVSGSVISAILETTADPVTTVYSSEAEVNISMTTTDTNEDDPRPVLTEDDECTSQDVPSEDGDSLTPSTTAGDGSSPAGGKSKKTPALRKRCSWVEAHHEWWNDGTLQAHQVYMYRWPNDRNGQKCLLQEQICLYLGIKSFKRRYPDLIRRAVGMEEMNYLKSCNVVSATQLALGLTALSADDVFELMANDFPSKYEEFQKALAEREKEDLARQQKEYQAIKLDAKKLEQLRMKAMRACSDWSYDVNHERMKERRKFFDLSTMIIQTRAVKPDLKRKIQTNFGAYPVAVISGQYQNFYRKYTPKELKQLPLNTITDSEFYAPKKSIMEIADEILDENCEDYDLCIPVLTDPNPSTELGTCDAAQGDRGEDTGEHCAFCQRDIYTNDRFVECTKCNSFAHPSCVDMPEQRFQIVKQYDWECMECKPCSVCSSIDQEDKMLFCDRCDRGYHTFCVGLDEPPVGNWHCPLFCKTPTKPLPQPPAAKGTTVSQKIAAHTNTIAVSNVSRPVNMSHERGFVTAATSVQPATVVYTQGPSTPANISRSVVYQNTTPVSTVTRGNNHIPSSFSTSTPVCPGSTVAAAGVNSHSPDGPFVASSAVASPIVASAVPSPSVVTAVPVQFAVGSTPTTSFQTTSDSILPPAISNLLANRSGTPARGNSLTPSSTPGSCNGSNQMTTPKPRIAPNDPPFLCEDCDREFSSKWNLQRHITQQHESCKPRSATAPKRVPAICKECSCKLVPQNRAAGKRGVKNMRICKKCAGQE